MEHRRKRLSAGVLALVPALTIMVAAAPSWAAAAPEPTSCVAHRLPLPAGQRFGTVGSGSPDGRYLIGYDENNMVVWRDRKVAAVARPGQTYSAVNNRGTVVGTTGVAHPRPAVLHGKTMTPLKGVKIGTAWGVSTSGVIVGTRDDPTRPQVALRWSSATAAPVILAGPRGYPYASPSITDDGTVLVTFETPSRHKQIGKSVTYVWPVHGAVYRLPRPPVHGNPTQLLEIIALRAHFVAWRVAPQGNEPARTLRYDLRTRKYDFLPTAVDPQAVSLRGWVTGMSRGRSVELVLQTPNHTIALAPRWAAYGNAPVLSDDGRTAAGDAQVDDYDSVPLVWDCR